jgi:hypothetical protein
MYSSYSSKDGTDNQKLPFHLGVKLLENGAVDSVLQIGKFHHTSHFLQGSVGASMSCIPIELLKCFLVVT